MAVTNYAQEFGISNKWAPILFAVLYFFTFCWYTFQFVRRRSSIYGALALFSILRLIAFSLRAALANNTHDQTNRGIAIAYEIFYNLGFFSILLSTYNLLHNRRRVVNTERTLHRFANIFHRGGFFHFLLFLAVLLGLIGIILSLRGPNFQAGRSLSHTSIYIFLAATVLIAILAMIVIHLERGFRTGTGVNNTTGATGTAGGVDSTGTGMISRPLQWTIIALLATLLLLRTLFFAVSAHRRKNGLEGAQSNEHLWFPLAALTELLVLLGFLIPGLVPHHSILGHHGLNEKREAESVRGIRGSTDQPAGRGSHVV